VKLGFLRGVVLVSLGSVVAGLVLSACKADIVLPPPRGLAGDYVGTLTVVASDSTQTDRVIFTLRITDPTNNPDAGTYSHRFDTLGADSTDSPDLCDMPKGDWTLKNGKLILSPGNVGVSTCNETLVPTSIIDKSGGAVEEIPFGFRTANNPPPEDAIGDSLIISQDRLADNIKTTFRLVLTALPQ